MSDKGPYGVFNVDEVTLVCTTAKLKAEL
jgi:hypothetical protein